MANVEAAVGSTANRLTRHTLRISPKKLDMVDMVDAPNESNRLRVDAFGLMSKLRWTDATAARSGLRGTPHQLTE